MKRRLLTCAAVVLAIAGGITLRTLAQEREKPRTGALAKAPQAVQKAVEQLVGSNKISEFGTETTLGKTLSIVEFEVKGVEYAFGIDSAGNVVVRWVGVDQSVVPPAVIDTAKKAHPDGKVSETTIATVGDRLFYSVNVKTGNVLHRCRSARRICDCRQEKRQGGLTELPGPPRLALYSLTERANCPFHAEPPQYFTL